MSLYKLHTNSEKLYGWDRHLRVPRFAYEAALERYQKTDERSPDLESAIAMHPEWAYYYARDFITKGRWPEAESAIATDPQWACMYARDSIEGRWLDIGKPEVESVIATDPEWAYVYAFDVIRKRWPEAEPYIKQNSDWWNQYKKRFKIES